MVSEPDERSSPRASSQKIESTALTAYNAINPRSGAPQ
jgi:hypothetical protein